MGSKENNYRKIHWSEVIDTSRLGDKDVMEQFSIEIGRNPDGSAIFQRLTEKQFVEHELKALEKTGVGQEIFKDLLTLNGENDKTIITTSLYSDNEAFSNRLNINWEQEIKFIKPLVSLIAHELDHITQIRLKENGVTDDKRTEYEKLVKQSLKKLEESDDPEIKKYLAEYEYRIELSETSISKYNKIIKAAIKEIDLDKMKDGFGEIKSKSYFEEENKIAKSVLEIISEIKSEKLKTWDDLTATLFELKTLVASNLTSFENITKISPEFEKLIGIINNNEIYIQNMMIESDIEVAKKLFLKGNYEDAKNILILEKMAIYEAIFYSETHSVEIENSVNRALGFDNQRTHYRYFHFIYDEVKNDGMVVNSSYTKLPESNSLVNNSLENEVNKLFNHIPNELKETAFNNFGPYRTYNKENSEDNQTALIDHVKAEYSGIEKPFESFLEDFKKHLININEGLHRNIFYNYSTLKEDISFENFQVRVWSEILNKQANTITAVVKDLEKIFDDGVLSNNEKKELEFIKKDLKIAGVKFEEKISEKQEENHFRIAGYYLESDFSVESARKR